MTSIHRTQLVFCDKHVKHSYIMRAGLHVCSKTAGVKAVVASYKLKWNEVIV